MGCFIDGAVAVDREALKARGLDRVTYARPIDIGPDGDPVRVDEAWLVAASGEAVRCAIGPLSGGAGTHAQIPAGHLLF
jgi:hypothetical protein